MDNIFDNRNEYKALSDELQPLREAGKRIVMCSGTFDLFHKGHVKLLEEAKSNGDILVVAVKSDNAAKLKNVHPVTMKQSDRMYMVANCRHVDFVLLAEYRIDEPIPQFVFEDTAAIEWLKIFTPVVKAIRPDCFVHEDNKILANARKQLFARYNVEGIVNPRTEGVSTTMIIEQIISGYFMSMQTQTDKS